MKNIIVLIIVLALMACILFFMRSSTDSTGSASTTQPVTIMTAASASDLMTQIAGEFERETGVHVVIVTGGSNTLANQILSGAPADLFLSANADWANKIVEKGFSANSRPLLTNDLVLVVPVANPASISSPADLTGPQIQKIALAGENVPCGKYAQQALKSLNIYDPLLSQSKIVRGQDVRATLNFIERAEVEAGIVYSTDAKISGKVKIISQFDPKTFDPIVYPLVLLKTGETNASAIKFQSYLFSESARKSYASFGFKMIEPSRLDP